MRLGLFGVILCAALGACETQPSTRNWTPSALTELRAIAEAAPAEGLPPETSALEDLARFEAAASAPSPGDQVDFAADTLFDALAQRFARGATEPAQVDANWNIEQAPQPDLAALHAALSRGAAPTALLRGLLPQNREYAALRLELARVSAEPSSAVDAQGLTRDARIARLRVNLERWRWLPRNIPASRIEVRIAAQHALFIRNEEVAASHVVIVGAPDTQTPTFTADIRSITLNPSWDPPLNIVRQELLPRFQRNPGAAAETGFEALDGNGQVVSNVDWSQRPFPYRLRQRPGPGNALGRLRFNLPNRYAVFLHDTPSRALFARTDRALSHGCIRVNDPLGLAENVLNDPAWRREALQNAIDTGEQRNITVSPALPVYLLYFTAAIGDDGAIAYYDDIYRRDEAVAAALSAPEADLVALTGARAESERCPG